MYVVWSYTQNWRSPHYNSRTSDIAVESGPQTTLCNVTTITSYTSKPFTPIAYPTTKLRARFPGSLFTTCYTVRNTEGLWATPSGVREYPCMYVPCRARWRDEQVMNFLCRALQLMRRVLPVYTKVRESQM